MKKSQIDATVTWLVLAEDGTFSDALASELGSHGQTIRVRTGEKFHRVSPGLYEIDPANREDYVALLQDLRSERTSGRIELFMHGCRTQTDVRPAERVGSRRAARHVSDSGDSGAKSRAGNRIQRALRSCLQRVRREDFFAHSVCALNAFCGVIPIECPNITIKSHRSRSSHPTLHSAIPQLVRELVSPPSNEIIAYRGSSRWVQHFEPVTFEKPSTGTEKRSEHSIAEPVAHTSSPVDWAVLVWFWLSIWLGLHRRASFLPLARRYRRLRIGKRCWKRRKRRKISREKFKVSSRSRILGGKPLVAYGGHRRSRCDAADFSPASALNMVPFTALSMLPVLPAPV